MLENALKSKVAASELLCSQRVESCSSQFNFLSTIDRHKPNVSKLLQRSGFGISTAEVSSSLPPREKATLYYTAYLFGVVANVECSCLSLRGPQAICSTIAVAATGCKRRGTSAWWMKHRGLSGFAKVGHARPSYANGLAWVLFGILAKVYLCL